MQGTQAIVSKLTSLPFQRCQHKVTSLDSHAVPSGGVLVFVTGQLLVGPFQEMTWTLLQILISGHPVLQTEGESRPMPFSQVFHLANISGSWVVTNGKHADLKQNHLFKFLYLLSPFVFCRHLPTELRIALPTVLLNNNCICIGDAAKVSTHCSVPKLHGPGSQQHTCTGSYLSRTLPRLTS